MTACYGWSSHHEASVHECVGDLHLDDILKNGKQTYNALNLWKAYLNKEDEINLVKLQILM